MSTLAVRVSVPEDISAIIADVRDADRVELWRGWRVTPEKALIQGLETSSHVFTVHGSSPIAMFGVVPESALTGDGVAWMIGSNAIEKQARLFLRGSRPEFARLMQSYQRLSNWVDAENRLAVRWLEWLGFTIYPAAPFGPDRAPFHPFEAMYV